MSERLSLPPMQYVSPGDGHPDHGAIRPGRAARFNLGRAFAENSGHRSGALWPYPARGTLAHMAQPQQFEARLNFRVADALRAELEFAAKITGRTVSQQARAVLINWAAASAAARGGTAMPGNGHDHQSATERQP
jgi:hypothetical protein